MFSDVVKSLTLSLSLAVNFPQCLNLVRAYKHRTMTAAEAAAVATAKNCFVLFFIMMTQTAKKELLLLSSFPLLLCNSMWEKHIHTHAHVHC